MNKPLAEEQIKDILWEIEHTLYWRVPDDMVKTYLGKIEKVLRDEQD